MTDLINPLMEFRWSAPQWVLGRAPEVGDLVGILDCHSLSELIWVISDIFMAHHVKSQPSQPTHHEPFKYCGPCCRLQLAAYVGEMHKRRHLTWLLLQKKLHLGDFFFSPPVYLNGKLSVLCWMKFMRASESGGKCKQRSHPQTDTASLKELPDAFKKSIMILCVHLS